jgi:hypothetical protein
MRVWVMSDGRVCAGASFAVETTQPAKDDQGNRHGHYDPGFAAHAVVEAMGPELKF